MFLGTSLVFSMSVVWILGAEQWRDSDSNDPRKILAKEVVETLKARAHWFSRNGTGPGAEKDKNLNRLGALQPPPQGPAER
jgi:hypothetical protein